ncbi:SAM-dependent chlorinase/fluorinase [Streptomyces capparidis]
MDGRVGVPVLSFLTDYGLDDGFVAACHGVIASIAPHARVIDVTHLIPPQDVARGAAVLAQTAAHLPAGCVHIGVVDPGVGTARRPVAVVTARGDALVGPDNGLLLPAAEELGGITAAYELTNRELMGREISSTFHGRDIFAPVAARLALGTAPRETGPALDPADLVRLPAPVRRLDAAAGRAEGEVVTVDRFGNVQTSLTPELLAELGLRPGAPLRVAAGGAWHELPYATTFGEVPHGRTLVLADSSGLVALAVNGGSAAGRLGLAPGDGVAVEPVRARSAGSRPS